MTANLVDPDVAGTDGGPSSPPPADLGDGHGPAPADAPLQPASRLTTLISRAVVFSYLGVGLVTLALHLLARFARVPAAPVPDRWASLAFAGIAVGLALLIVQTMGARQGYGIFRPLVGADNRYSTSLTQVGLWTLVVATALAFLLGRVVFEGQDLDAVIDPDRWEQYLLLLGGPFAAAVLAKGLVTYKLDHGTLQETRSETTSVGQIWQDDNDEVELADTQYMIFNVIAVAYFVVRFVSELALPEFPPVLLAITSAGAGLYVANKAAASNAPLITAISPRTVRGGDTVVLHGLHFDPGGVSSPDRRVTISLSGSTQVLYPEPWSDTEAQFEVPTDAGHGPQAVQLTSTAGIQTAPAPLTVVSTAPFVTGVVPDVLVRGRSAELQGTGLLPPGEAIRVTVGSIPTTGRPGPSGGVSFTVPRNATVVDGLVAIEVAYANGASVALSLPIDPAPDA